MCGCVVSGCVELLLIKFNFRSNNKWFSVRICSKSSSNKTLEGREFKINSICLKITSTLSATHKN